MNITIVIYVILSFFYPSNGVTHEIPNQVFAYKFVNIAIVICVILFGFYPLNGISHVSAKQAFTFKFVFRLPTLHLDPMNVSVKP